MQRFFEWLGGVLILVGLVVGYGWFLWVAVGAALGVAFPFGVLLGGVIVVVTFFVFAYVMYMALVLTMEWITGKRVDFR